MLMRDTFVITFDFFNGHFSFTSLYCCLDNMTTNMDCGIYTFCAHGMMYHNVRSFGREAGAEHKHLELYFYDDDATRIERSERRGQFSNNVMLHGKDRSSHDIRSYHGC
jgi:hypothetical protein